MTQTSPLNPLSRRHLAKPARRFLFKPTVLAIALALLGPPGVLLPKLASAQEAAAVQSATVNINAADAPALAAALRGVGQSRAEEIVRYRETFGPFKSVDELLDVKGIGPATVDANRALITLE